MNSASVIDVKRGKDPILKNIENLDTLEGTRAFYQEVISLFATAGISENNLRALCYALSGYLSYWRLIKDVEIEEQLDEIRERLDKK